VALVVIPRKYTTRPGIKIRAAWLPYVEQIGTTFDVLVSSAYRTHEENQRAGGARNSDHLRGDAADFVGPRPALLALHAWAARRFPYVEPMKQAGTHVHISFKHGGVSAPPGTPPKGIKALAGRAAVRALRASCRRHNMDWEPAAAVAYTEGAGGEIGDGGTSYGPWQLHIGGALPRRWARLGKYSTKTQYWAWSQAGIEYAVSAMARAGAAGKHGDAAIHAIVYNFERPKDKAREAQAARERFALLHGMGANAPAAAAPWFAGPRGTVTTPPPPTPTGGRLPPAHVRRIRTPGVSAAWRSLIEVFSHEHPKQHVAVTRLAKSLPGIFKR
jgi:hypothetical protein